MSWINNIIKDSILRKYPLQFNASIIGDEIECWVLGSRFWYNYKTKELRFKDNYDEIVGWFELIELDVINTDLLQELYLTLVREKQEKIDKEIDDKKIKSISKKAQEEQKKYAEALLKK